MPTSLCWILGQLNSTQVGVRVSEGESPDRF
jgi:hypothetical protein